MARFSVIASNQRTTVAQVLDCAWNVFGPNPVQGHAAASEILVRRGKGGKDRDGFPARLRAALQLHLTRVKTLHDRDLARELLGHADVSTTMIHTHVLNREGLGVRSPVDLLGNCGRSTLVGISGQR